MKILLDTYKNNKENIYIPESIKRRSLEYLTYSHWLFKWFMDEYENDNSVKPENI